MEKLYLQEILKGLDLSTPLEQLTRGYYVDALNVEFKSHGRRMGDLHPAPSMQPVNFIFRTRTMAQEDKDMEGRSLYFYIIKKIDPVVNDTEVLCKMGKRCPFHEILHALRLEVHNRHVHGLPIHNKKVGVSTYKIIVASSIIMKNIINL